ncbi:unnamed protein product [Triticum turgidum subsp. durum]|uniref:Uncharacterized protein n=1 Tax=Triticum turgidum subsp. durum TaxID=4567 RepID=A0A9R1AT97_TRITD|nr:unnamed protein product [Triticum turgidum subsp. durum]
MKVKPGTEPATGVPVGGAPGAPTAWSSGLFDCFDDCGLCCLTCCCPCITFGKVAEIVDRGATSCGTSGALYVLLASLTGCHWIYSCTYRSKMRAQYALPDAPCCDCCVHYCCEPCALVQEYKELKARGYDPEIGWHLNVERRNGGAGAGGVNPPGMQEMGR